MDNTETAFNTTVVIALVIWAIAQGLSIAVTLYRHALTRVESRNGVENGSHTGLSRSALGALVRAPLETAFTLLMVRVVLDGIGIIALTAYLLERDPAAWAFVLSLMGGLGLALLLPLAFYPVLRGHWQRAALLGAPLGVIITYACGPVASPLFRLNQSIAGRPESLPEITSELEARFNRVFIPVSKEVNPPDERELAMIHAILRLEETAVRDIMVPRPDMVVIDVGTTVSDAVAAMGQAGHSRIPVHDNGVDNIKGILHARDLLKHVESPNSALLQDYLRPALFVPEGKRVDELLLEFQRQRGHMAVVVDEYGGTAGLVTLEDILEEIVGDIVDEFNQEEQEIQVISNDEVILDARVNLSFLKEHFAVDLAGDGFDTMGGLVFNKLGKIPSQGDQIVAGGLRVEVLSTAGRRITRVRVQRQ